MSIIMDEFLWAEDAIRTHSLGKHPKSTLMLVAKYYYSLGYKNSDVRKRLEEFLTSCDPGISAVLWSDTLDAIQKYASKHPPVRVSNIVVTQPEMDRIDAIEGVQMRRIAFTLLCIAKFWDAARETNNHWVNTSDVEIMRMANVSTSVIRQNLLIGELGKLGLIRFARRSDNLNIQVMYTEDGEPAMTVRDMRNLGYQYLRYHGGTFIECAECGLVVKPKNPGKGRKQKYCPECAASIAVRQRVDSVMRRRYST